MYWKWKRWKLWIKPLLIQNKRKWSHSNSNTNSFIEAFQNYENDNRPTYKQKAFQAKVHAKCMITIKRCTRNNPMIKKINGYYLAVSFRQAKLWPKQELTIPAKRKHQASSKTRYGGTPARVLSQTFAQENKKWKLDNEAEER